MRRVENANQSAGAGNFNNYNFDFGLGNGLNKGSSSAPLKEQKLSGSAYWTSAQAPKPAASHSASSGWSVYQASSAGRSGQSNKSSSTASSQTWGSSTTSSQTGWAGYQPMTQGLGGANKAAGSRSMNAAAINSSLRSDSSKLAAAGIGGVAQNQSKGDDVFGDLLGAALNRSNVPLRSNAVPKSSFSMGNIDSSLPKPGEPVRQTGQPMASMSRSAPPPETRRAAPSSAEKDPFPPVSGPSSAASFENDVFSFPSGSTSSTEIPASRKMSAGSDPFAFSGASGGIGGSSADPFEFGQSGRKSNVLPQRAPPPAKSTPLADPFDVFNQAKSSSSTATRKSVDPLDSLLSRSTAPASKSPSPPPAPVQDDGWGIFGADSGGGSSAGGNEPTTTELEGLPPPPIGVTAKSANDKGSEFYKTGQFPDAIKWLSWSIELLKRSPDSSLMLEVLTCRMSCFKEIGEMKKAVADCSKAIELQPASATLIMLRANLYESMEKYKLGVADLRLVLKIDPDHRQARATLSRLERMIGK